MGVGPAGMVVVLSHESHGSDRRMSSLASGTTILPSGQLVSKNFMKSSSIFTPSADARTPRGPRPLSANPDCQYRTSRDPQEPLREVSGEQMPRMKFVRARSHEGCSRTCRSPSRPPPDCALLGG